MQVYFPPRQHYQQQQQQWYAQDVRVGTDVDMGMDMSYWDSDETDSGDDGSGNWDGNWNLTAALQTWDDVIRDTGGMERFERQW